MQQSYIISRELVEAIGNYIVSSPTNLIPYYQVEKLIAGLKNLPEFVEEDILPPL
jgi:hypothetical protein